MDKKIILSVLIVAIIGIVAATYQINVGDELLNPLANVQTEDDAPVSDALAAPAANPSDDNANAKQSDNQQPNTEAQQQAQSQAQQQAQQNQAQQNQAQQNQAQQQANSNNDNNQRSSDNSGSSANTNANTNNNNYQRTSDNSANTNNNNNNNNNRDVVSSVSEARSYALVRMQDSGMTLGDGYRDTDTNGNLVYVFPLYNYNGRNIGSMYVYPDGEIQAPDVTDVPIPSLNAARTYALEQVDPSQTVLSDGYETTDVNGDLVYKFTMYNHDGSSKGDMYIYPDGEVQAPDVSYQG